MVEIFKMPVRRVLTRVINSGILGYVVCLNYKVSFSSFVQCEFVTLSDIIFRCRTFNWSPGKHLCDQIRACLFKSKYIPGVRVECPRISGLHRMHFGFPFFSTFSTSTRVSTFLDSVPSLCISFHAAPHAFFYTKPNSLASSRTLQDYFLRVRQAGWETANVNPHIAL